MLQPRSYPAFIAKALVLENEPFEAMVDDDNPWMEGFVLVATVSLLAGVAAAVGSFLTALTLPAPDGLYITILQGGRQLAIAAALSPAAVERIISEVWMLVALVTGYAGGWSHLLPILSIPGFAIIWWLFFGVLAFGVGRAMGSNASINATLGAAALIVAPLIFFIFNIVPFAGPNPAPIAIWSLLIGYRAIQVSQELEWRQAAIATLIVYVAGFLAVAALVVAFGLGYAAGGFR
ncbi:MAG: YIP1 family protein [Caldilinea sp.]|nr:YIP1 family protein [Caldilinea sp.]MDW8440349.1 YIP1 family protein [Caldilineaceae bacterium]